MATNKNRAKASEYERKYRLKDIEGFRATCRARSALPENVAKKKAYQARYRALKKDSLRSKYAEYYSQNKEKILRDMSTARSLKKKTDPAYKIKCTLRSRFRTALKAQKINKNCSALTLCGCKIDDLKAHIESLFMPGMSWENHGYYGWHIDHIKPCSSFDLTLPEEQKKCFHYTNLQPLWWVDNLSKNDFYQNNNVI